MGDLSLGFHDTEIRTEASGAPSLDVRGERSPLQLSLSHDGGIAFAVVTGGKRWPLSQVHHHLGTRDLAGAIAKQIGRKVDHLDVETDGAARAAARISALLRPVSPGSGRRGRRR